MCGIIFQLLLGHAGRVNCLLYPNNEHPRYDVAHLVSGSVDFSVCLWDIYTGTLLHRFSAQVWNNILLILNLIGLKNTYQPIISLLLD